MRVLEVLMATALVRSPMIKLAASGLLLADPNPP